MEYFNLEGKKKRELNLQHRASTGLSCEACMAKTENHIANFEGLYQRLTLLSSVTCKRRLRKLHLICQFTPQALDSLNHQTISKGMPSHGRRQYKKTRDKLSINGNCSSISMRTEWVLLCLQVIARKKSCILAL
ncbi:unnamed protein product [Lathyrus oleraceus]